MRRGSTTSVWMFEFCKYRICPDVRILLKNKKIGRSEIERMWLRF